MGFKNEFSVEQRKEEASRVLQKYPDRLPIICEKAKTAKDCPDIDKKKYLIPRDLTMGQFIYVVRKRLSLAPEKAIFLFVGNSIAPSTSCINEIYNYHKDVDGFLYITYSFENVFGFHL
jgi:GABA(A) receptor-associated protein